MEVAGVPLIFIGRSGENIGQTDIQVWEKVNVSKEAAARRTSWDDGRWMICFALSILFVIENILVRYVSFPIKRGLNQGICLQQIPVIYHFRQWTAWIVQQILPFFGK